MQPTATPILTVNNFSKEMLAKRDAWCEAQGVKSDELLVFRKIGNGAGATLEVKSTEKKAEHLAYEQVKLTNASFNPPSHESIQDPNSTTGFVQMIYFEGGYFPGKPKSPLPFRGGADDTIAVCVPEDKPELYDFLTLSPRLKGGINSKNLPPQFELVRPEMVVEASWDQEEAYSDIIQAIKNASIDTLRFLAPKILLPTEGVIDQRMKKNFADYAKLSPTHVAKLKTLFDADETAIYKQVEAAITADVIAVDEDKMVWVLSSTQAAITPANRDKNKLDQIVNFLMTEPDQVTYKQIMALTAEAKKAAGRTKKDLVS
jgi:hypothetical protein